MNFFNKGNEYNNSNNYMDSDYSNLQVRYNNLLSKYENSQINEKYIGTQYKKLKGAIENLCKLIMSNEYTLNQLGGESILKSMDEFKMIEFATMDLTKQRINHLELSKSLNDQLLIQQQIIETLKNQLTQAMVNNNDITLEDVENSQIIDNTNDEFSAFEMPKVEVNNNQNKNTVSDGNKKSSKIQLDKFGNVVTEQKKPTHIDVSANTQPNKPINRTSGLVKDENSRLGSVIGQVKQNVKPQQPINNNPIVDLKPKQEQKQEQGTLTIENVDAYMASMTPLMWDIVELIGKEGFAKSNDILDKINSGQNKVTKSNVLNSLSSLAKMTVLTVETVSTGYRRFNIYKLSNKGNIMFKKQFGMEPVESEITKISRDHDNVHHGYTIKDAAELMETVHKCTNVTIDRKEVSFKLPNAKTYIPDIVATRPDGVKMYMEVELGNTPQNDFEDKCSKMLQVTKDLYFITDVDDTIKKKLEKQISKWVVQAGGKEKISGTTIYITTMTQLSKKEWSKVMKY